MLATFLKRLVGSEGHSGRQRVMFFLQPFLKAIQQNTLRILQKFIWHYLQQKRNQLGV